MHILYSCIIFLFGLLSIFAMVQAPQKTKILIVYLQLGHDHHAYENESYRTLLRQAIKWVAAR